MNFFYFELMSGIQTSNLLEEGIRFAGGNQMVEGLLSNFYMLRHSLSFGGVVTAAYVCLRDYFAADYASTRRRWGKSNFVMNIIDSAHIPLVLLHNLLEKIATVGCFKPVRKWLKQVLGNIDSILACNQNAMDVGEEDWKAVSKAVFTKPKLYSYDVSLAGSDRYVNPFSVQLRASEYLNYCPHAVNPVTRDIRLFSFLNKTEDMPGFGGLIQDKATQVAEPDGPGWDNYAKVRNTRINLDFGAPDRTDGKALQLYETDPSFSILLIMSDKGLIEDMQRGLSVYFRITVLDDPDWARGTVASHLFHAILIDETVNGVSGDEICNLIKTNGMAVRIPIVLLVNEKDEKSESYFSHIGSRADRLELRTIDMNKLAVDLHLLINSYAEHRKQARNFLDDLPPVFLPAKTKENEEDLKFMEKVGTLLSKNILEQKYTVEMLSFDVGVSRTKFYTKIKRLTGLCPSGYILRFKLRMAIKLLVTGDYNITEVSGILGFCDSKYFGKRFKEIYHTCPTKYLQNNSGL